MILPVNGIQRKKAGVAILMSDKIDFKTKKKDSKRQKWTFYNEEDNLSRRYDSY